ncbi:methyltransferase domain-containing protein [Roseomonas sp. SSH11]|uniref:Methyltransferase domain-containing protein n=1 Tax=Pararoseomonas baculiformis TaxID=2820812 RepID=A0ABS4AJD3_9PROT|nr:methyltransferase domain-containing protein [Pararoseomonas baculiformis]MBP0446334.1 methyltransferase domain-containing protein [Pararoseomonas baculiformis]
MGAEVHFTAWGLQGFYDAPLGAVTRRILRARLRQIWPELAGQEVLGLGHAGPYLRLWRRGAARLVSATPVALAAGDGMAPWPLDGNCAAALVEEERLPFPDMSFDNILLVHGLEAAENARRLLREAWRVLRPEGRMLAVVPNRRSVWAHLERTPFGHGHPYSPGQLARLLERAMFTVERREAALFIPPFGYRPLLRGARIWEAGGRMIAPQLGGVTVIEARKTVQGAIPVRGLPARSLATRARVRVPQPGWAVRDAARAPATRSSNPAGAAGEAG